MNITKEQLAELGFKLTHECVRVGEASAKFVPAQRGVRTMVESFAPMVYLWVSPSDDEFETLYVGKAGLGVHERLKAHKGGFTQSSPGRKNLANILELLDAGREILVYARIAGTGDILDLGKSINLYSVEEEAIFESFRPAWNRAQFAGGKKRAQKEGQGRKAAGRPVAAPTARATLAVVEPEHAEVDGIICGDIDVSQMIRSGLLIDFHAGLDDANRERLCRLLHWGLALEASEEADTSIIGQYANQPMGYNGLPMFLVAERGPSGRAKKDGWVMRIPLRCDDHFPLTVILPTRTLGAQAQEHEIVRGKHPNFRPVNLDDFLARPGHYTTLT